MVVPGCISKHLAYVTIVTSLYSIFSIQRRKNVTEHRKLRYKQEIVYILHILNGSEHGQLCSNKTSAPPQPS